MVVGNGNRSSKPPQPYLLGKKRRGREEGKGKKRVTSVLIGSLIEPFSGWTVVLLVCMCLQLQDVATNTHFRELLFTFNAHSGFPRILDGEYEKVKYPANAYSTN